MIKGIFLSDLHIPENIALEPIHKFIKDYKPNLIILGGDIIDAVGMHASESMKAEQVKMSWYERDVKYLKDFFARLPKVKIVFLEGNHEQRWRRISAKYPEVFGKTVDLKRDSSIKSMEYIPYGDYNAFYKVGDMIFHHGTVFPDMHAKQYAYRYAPYKSCYGHQHDFQAYSLHRALVNDHFRYGFSGSCLCKTNPEWKRGSANRWVNLFTTFVSDGKTTIPTIHLIEKDKFYYGGKEYK
jgi:predicted phosphodiesterase